MSERSHRTTRRIEADESYQVDAIVSLFAIVLLLLLLSAVATASGVTRMEYRTRDLPSQAFRLLSFDAPFKRPEFWIVTDEALLLVDFDAAARILGEVDPRFPANATEPETRLDIYLTPSEGHPGGYSEFKIQGDLPDTPGGLVRAVVDPGNRDALEAWAARPAPARLVLTGAEAETLPGILQAAEAGGRPVSLSYRSRSDQLVTHKLPGDFTFRDILRAQ